MIGVTENLRKIRDLLAKSAVEAGRDPATVKLLAVSKKQPVNKILEAARSGQRDFGENFVQEALEKIALAEAQARLEFEDSPAIPSDDPTGKAQGASASSDSMLRAIAQLLVEKGVFTREELVKQLQVMSKPTGGA